MEHRVYITWITFFSLENNLAKTVFGDWIHCFGVLFEIKDLIPFFLSAAFRFKWDLDNILLWHCHVSLHMAQCYRKLTDNDQVRATFIWFTFWRCIIL